MEASKKAVIINASVGGWYWKGQERLIRSLIHHGYTHDILTWKEEWPNDEFDKECIYNIKASAFQEAINRGYELILWLDSSCWAVNDPGKLLDHINDQGYYIGTSGFNCAQTCSDKCLEYFGVSRDEAEPIADSSTGVLGLNMANPIALSFYQKWIEVAKAGIYNGSRLHDNQSKDSRFLFHRQDQSCASIIANQLKMKLTPFGEYVSYYPADLDKVIFTLRGL
jgi:hypothetical protein